LFPCSSRLKVESGDTVAAKQDQRHRFSEGRVMLPQSTIRAERAERAALASIASEAPTILVNRAIGLGVAYPAVPSTVAAVVGHYREAGVGRYFLHLDPKASPGELAGWLEASGLEAYHRAWAKFQRGVEPVSEVDTDLEVREIGPEHAGDFGRIAAAGFELDDAWIPALAGLVGRQGWHVYLSFDGDTTAGCGAMRIHDGIGWLDWAATLPEFRRRGSQGAVLSRRIADGIALGCDGFATATGEKVGGDPQHSYRNILRYGFRRTHARANWVPV
jgi:hypothetical protein